MKRLENKQSDTRSVRLLLVDDDPVYSTIIDRVAQQQGVQIDTFHSLEDLGSVGALNYYDGAILDIDLGANSVSGLEIADYIEALKFDVPVIVVSASDISVNNHTLPSCVHKFMHKSVGYQNVVSEIVQCSANIEKKATQSLKRYLD